MNTLTIKLKQHTPLIHFQHDQDGATLRASEVKPKLDKYILTQMGNGNYENGVTEARKRGWIIGEKPSLDYRMRIESSNDYNISIPVKPSIDRGSRIQQKDDIGQPLYTTNNYPDNMHSLIMSNIGGRTKSNVMNLKIFGNVTMTITTRHSDMSEQIENNIYDFIYKNNFGNRKSKGFGSFEVESINGKTIDGYLDSDSYILSFTMNLKKAEKRDTVYKDVFIIIHRIWKNLKRSVHVKGDNMNNVLLNVQPQRIKNAERIPSPIIFKPLVDIRRNECDVNIAVFFDQDVINSVTDPKKTQYYNDLLKKLKEKGENILRNLDENQFTYNKIDISSVKID